jgi:lipid A ethanolaminephosphotransferase
MWASQGYAQRFKLSMNCARHRTGLTISHDHYYHTVLGAAGVRNAVYDVNLDVLAGCRDEGFGLGHE